MSFKLPDNLLKLPNNTAKQLMNKIVARQNGDVANAMKTYGYNYELNYGVSIPIIKKIAETTKKNHEVAIHLRQNYNVREALILSSFIDEPEKVTAKDTVEIIKLLTTKELIQQFAKNLFSHKKTLPNLLDANFYENTTWYQLCFWSLGWVLRYNRNINQTYLDLIITEMYKNIYYSDTSISKAIIFAIQEIAQNINYKQKINSLTEYLANSDNKIMKQTGEEFIWLNS